VIVCPTFMIGAFDSRPSSGEMIRQFIVRKPPAVPAGGRSFVCVQDAARAAAAALTRGRRGETYILGGHNLTYVEFFTKVAQVSGVRPPKRMLPAGLILLGGVAGSLYEKVTGRQSLITLPIARLAPMGTYYSSAKAMTELGMVHTPIEQGIGEAIAGLKEYGHLS
jgi:dihydroflavonol-4-reductase